jgi:hypothetical protein
MANTRSLKPNMSPRSSASQIRKVPTVDNATAFSALPAATCVFRHEHLVAASVGAAIMSSEPHDAGGQCRFIVRRLEASSLSSRVCIARD